MASVKSQSFARSEALLERARKLLPGGVTSNVRLGDVPFPLFFARGQGSRLWDVDGNEYIDYVMARGPLILGHSPKAVLERVMEAIGCLQLCAAQTEWEIVVAEKIVECVPCAQTVRFSLSGSEAVQAALRLARAHTGRKKIIKFEGHYHGWLDSILVGTGVAAQPRGGVTWSDECGAARTESAGQDPKASEDLIVLPWNDLESVEQAFRDYAGQIAAVITEPILCNNACILPEPGYLQGLRSFCEESGAVLIFDEVITGFRVGLSGAQGYLGVTPDLGIFGKGVAGGFPLSVLAGGREMMQRMGSGEVNHSGTFNGHVASLAAASATIDELRSNNAQAFVRMQETGKILMEEIPKLFSRQSLPCLVQGLPCKFFVGITEQERITNARSAAGCNYELYRQFATALMSRGVRVVPKGNFAVSAAHTNHDAYETLSRMEDALKSVVASKAHKLAT